ncbi:unnamed protein product [Absidia cylindrospora]
MKFTLVTALVSFAMLVQAAPIEKRNSGSATYYDVGLGSCGNTNSNSEMVAALSSSIMNKSKCGKSINIKSPKGSVTVKVVDTCPGCDSNAIDLSPAAFKKLGDMNDGRIDVTWSM